MTILEYLTKTEPLWLLIILFVEMVSSLLTLYWVKREFDYDEQKDIEKKQRRTRTTKKTTTDKAGTTITEESQEITEPMNHGEQK